MIIVNSSGSFNKTMKFLNTLSKREFGDILDKYAKVGLNALQTATPIDTGLAASSWEYEVVKNKGVYSIIWSNTNTENGLNVAILIQYGHATKNGAWIEGRDYINPAIVPIFDKISADLWERVRNA